MRLSSTFPPRMLAIVLFSALFTAASTATADNFTWTGAGGNATWSDTANWTNTTPGGTDLFPTADDNVSFPADATVTGGSAKDLLTANGFTLSLNPGTVTAGGTITNVGTITYANDTSNGSNEILDIDGTVTLDGGGEIVLNNSQALLGNGSAGEVLINTDNTIRGNGRIYAAVTNQGTIRAEGGTLSVFRTIDNAAGQVEIADDGILDLKNFILAGGSLTLESGSVLKNAKLTNLNVTGDLVITPNSGVSLTSTYTNTGTITYAADTSNGSDEILDIDGTVTLDGGGEIVLNNSQALLGNGSAGEVLINTDNTIRGNGRIYAAVTNQGTIRAEGGTLDVRRDITSTGTVAVAAGAELEFSGSRLQASTLAVDPAGTFDFNGSRLEVLDFVGDFDHDQGTYAPGASPAVSTLSGNYTATGGTLEIEIEGTAVGEFDQLLIGGDATLSGVGLSVVSQTGFTATPGDVFGIISVGGTRTGLFNSNTFIEGATVATLGSPLRITYTAGDGNDIALFTTTNSTSVVFETAGPGDDVYFLGNRGLTQDTNTFVFGDFEILDGQGFTLGPNETMILDNGQGTLFVREGAVLSGNGIVDGNVSNSGLVRVPIVRVQNITRVTGGLVEIIRSGNPPAFFNEPVVFNPTTFVRFAGGGSGGGSGGGGGGGGGGTISSPVVNAGVFSGSPAPVTRPNGSVEFDASLEVTGSYEQTETGALRLFIAGEEAGVSYSQLVVGEEVTLNGELQIVFDLDLFSEFGYMPVVGQTFDLITAVNGIAIDPSGIDLLNFVTLAGSENVRDLTLSSYDSGFAADPDTLLQIAETLFSIELVDNNTILRATLIRDLGLIVPEPTSIALLLSCLVGIATTTRRSR